MKFRGSGGRGRCRQQLRRGVSGWLDAFDQVGFEHVDVGTDDFVVSNLSGHGDAFLEVVIPVVDVELAIRVLVEFECYFFCFFKCLVHDVVWINVGRVNQFKDGYVVVVFKTRPYGVAFMDEMVKWFPLCAV